MNEITNTRIIPFSQHKSLNLHFTEKTRNNFKRWPFCFFRRIIFLLFLFPGERWKHISFLCGFQGEMSQNISLWFFKREFSLREFSLRERNKIIKKYIFIFNSGSFWVVIKLLETVPPFSHLFESGRVGSGQVSPLEHPNPTPTVMFGKIWAYGFGEVQWKWTYKIISPYHI